MPIFEYHCEECGKTFERLVLGSDEPVECQYCKAEKVHRLMSACSFKSKGSGGEVTSASASSSSSCSGCTSGSCSTCGG